MISDPPLKLLIEIEPQSHFGRAHADGRMIGRTLHKADHIEAEMESLARVSVSRKTGAEPLTAAGLSAGPTLADFWGWSRSDLLDNLSAACWQSSSSQPPSAYLPMGCGRAGRPGI